MALGGSTRAAGFVGLRSAAVRIEVDPDICTGHGRCYALAPDLFEADDDGYCSSLSLELRPDQETQARIGVDSCPEGAIRLLD